MKSLMAHVGALAAGATILACGMLLDAPAPAETDGVVLGTFDSRAVAIAWARTEAFSEELAGLHAELAQAKASGDAERVAELEAHGPALQRKLHRMGFSTAPVDEPLALITDRIPGIAEQAGVDVIVSRWDVVYEAPGVSTVDVTELMVKAFDVDEDGLKAAMGIVDQEPVPLDEIDGLDDH